MKRSDYEFENLKRAIRSDAQKILEKRIKIIFKTTRKMECITDEQLAEVVVNLCLQEVFG